ncbi:MAG: sensor histidine kinase [Bdellovibrionales bacterium]
MRIAAVGFLFVVACTLGGGILAYYARLDYASRAIESSLSSSLIAGDTFQLSRMVESLFKSEGILAVALTWGDSAKVVASAGDSQLIAKAIGTEKRFSLVSGAYSPSVVLKHKIFDQSEPIGELSIVSALPIGILGGTVACFGLLFLLGGYLIVDAAKKVAHAITIPQERLSERLKKVDNWTEVPESDLRFAELIEIQREYGALANRLKIAAEQATVGLIASKVRHDATQAILALKVGLKRLSFRPSVSDVEMVMTALKRIEFTIREIPKLDLSTEPLPEFTTRAEGPMPATLESHEVAGLIEPLVTEFSALAVDSGKTVDIHLELFCDARSLLVKVDPERFRRMIVNLLANSIEAISESGEVLISVCDTPASLVEIRISDTGKGIPPHLIGSIGKPGFTFGKAHGSGVGLSSAVEYVTQWQGSLTVDSEEGSGTTVVISLPKGAAPRKSNSVSRLA